MKTISKCIAILLVSFMMVACDDMNSIIQDDLDRGEAIYPGKIQNIIAMPGKGRAKVMWVLNPDTRIVKTVITWENDGKIEKIEKIAEGIGTRIDSIDVTGLAEGTYTFSAYTVDKDGHQSIGVESYPAYIYGNNYVNTLSSRGISATEMSTSGTLRITWRGAASDGMLYTIVTYVDHRDNPNGVTRTVDTVRNNATTTDLPGLKRLKPFTVKSVYGVGYLGDTTSVTSSYYPSVIEKTILENNGLTELTDEAASRITKLSFPLSAGDWAHGAWTLKDLYYFPNLRELDLTPGTEGDLPTLTYERNNVTSTVGGGPWFDLASGFMNDADIAIINDLLASGQLTKIKYRPNSYPKLDATFAAYSDRIERTAAVPPNEIMIPRNMLVDYRVEDNTKGAEVEYSEDGSIVPAEIAAKFGGDLKNVYRVKVTASNSTIAFSVPEGVQFIFNPHGNLKMDLYLDARVADTVNYEWMRPAGISKYESWNNVKLWRKNRFENFPETTTYGYYSSGPVDAAIWNVSTELGTWKSYSWALVTVPHEHIRVITIQMGNTGAVWGLPSGRTLYFYIANLRMAKP
ncbi:MAG: DUF4998 domain-containing protein [Prevotellaceae bacterium]|jgi:hypothetical protein|nr:DUF4998 domain-containing protein [Prevotellaceae bacterium]